MVSEVAHRAGYDLSSWQGIAKVLADARAKLSGAEYHSFYDLVTAYSRGRGTDAAQRAQIEKVIAGWGASVVASTAAEQAPAESAVAPVKEEIHEDVPVETDTEADAVLAAALREQAQPATASSTKEVSESVAKAMTLQESPRIVPEEKPVAPEHLMTLEEARSRIAEIKHEVHELVGNPVVLVGELGTIGKSYMQSLLKATRATMGGSGGALMPSMRELEGVYEQLRMAALTGPEEVVETAVPTIPTASHEEDIPPAAEQEHSEAPNEDVPNVDSPEIVSEPAVQAEGGRQSPEDEVADEPARVPETLPAEPEMRDVPVEKPLPPKAPAPLRVATRPRPQFRAPARESVVERREAERSVQDDELLALRARLNALEHTLEDVQKHPHVSDVPETVPQTSGAHEVQTKEVAEVQPEVAPAAHEEPVVHHAEKSAPDKKPADAEGAADAPLHTLQPTFMVVKKDREIEYQAEAVSDGLRSLLMSWDIFRGGLLSGKARGIEHPLYREIREKSMSDVLAGKFTGAKTHVVISVNDYVNAWRFEQGIEYSPAETFEHYLRRVIHRILTRTGTI